MPGDRRRAVNGAPTVLDSNLIGSLHHVIAVSPVGPVEMMNLDHPVPVHNVIILLVNHDAGAKNTPAALHPGSPPGRVVLPAVRGDVNAVLPPQNIPNRFPIVHIDEAAIVRMVSAAAIGISFDRLHDDFFPVEIFIPYNLKDGLSVSNDFNFDNGHVLDIIPADHGLQNDGVKIPLLSVFNPDVINSAVIIQVQVVHPMLFRVQLPLKIP